MKHKEVSLMDYLKEEFKGYRKARAKGIPYFQFAPFKAMSLCSLALQLQPHIQKKSKILEVGQGSGYILSLFEKLGFNTFGVDIEPFAVHYAKMLLKDEGHCAHIRKANGFNLPFKDAEMDVAYNFGVIEHYTEKKQLKMLEEMKRVSSDKIVVAVPNEHKDSDYQGYKKSPIYIAEHENAIDLVELCKKADLSVVATGAFNAAGAYIHEQNLEIKNASDWISIDVNLPLEYKERKAMFKYVVAQKNDAQKSTS